ncbi:MAG: hydroxyacid dehydrogenase [Candidatus ainarchaeum sp.]|nr:hydroxyacid dehydrogenase [Candidatus ainarchaeum sp.]
MARVVVADGLDEGAVAELGKAFGPVSVKPADLGAELADAEILIVRSKTRVTPALLALAPKLKVVARAGVGLDNVDADACAERGIAVFNTPDASTVAVAEFAVAMIFSLLRHLPRADACMRASRWEKSALAGRELSGKTVGIIGFGRIGSSVADRLRPFGCRILTFSLEFLKNPGDTEVVPLEELLARSDIVTLHVPLTPETRHMMNAERIALMKPDALIVNTARGELVDEEALYCALKAGKLGGAALDVYPVEPYSGKLCGLENVVLTPHIAGSTAEGQARIGRQLVEKLKEIRL